MCGWMKSILPVPAFVTIYGDNHCWEYALLLDGNRIAYVFPPVPGAEGDRVPPRNICRFIMERKRKERVFSIYLFDVGDGVRAGDF